MGGYFSNVAQRPDSTTVNDPTTMFGNATSVPGMSAFGTNPPTAATNPPAQVPPFSLPSGGSSFPVGAANTGVSPLDTSLSNEFLNYLQSQIGLGAPGFNKPVTLPTGGRTAPGSLTAPLSPTGVQLENLSLGKTSTIPGATSLGQLAATGGPITALPEWKAAVAASQQNIANNAALLREQYNVGGANPGSSSPGSLGMANFYEQTAKDQNAALLAAQTQALESAQNRKESASQFLTQVSTTLGELFQGYDQTAIQNALTEFIRTSPQYSPLLSAIYGAATTFPPTVPNQYSPYLTALIGIIPNLITSIGEIIPQIGGKPKQTPTPTPTPTPSPGPTPQSPTPQGSTPPTQSPPTSTTSTTVGPGGGVDPTTGQPVYGQGDITPNLPSSIPIPGVNAPVPTYPGVSGGITYDPSTGTYLNGIPGVNAPVPPYDPGVNAPANSFTGGWPTYNPTGTSSPYLPYDSVSGGVNDFTPSLE